MSQEKTQWFDGRLKPAHVGVYERKLPWGGTAFWHWSGRWDYGGEEIPSRAIPNRHPSPEQNLQWRGLAKKPRSNNNQGE